MITKVDLLNNGWTPTEDRGFFTKGKLEKKIGRATYIANVEDKLWISVFVGQDPEELSSMSMRSVLYNGKCPDMKIFDYIFELISVY